MNPAGWPTDRPGATTDRAGAPLALRPFGMSDNDKNEKNEKSEKGDAEKNENETKREKGKSKLLPVMIVLNLLLAGGVAALLVLRPSGAASVKAPPKEAKPQKPAAAHGDGNSIGPTFKIDNLVVLLRSQPGVERYARIAFEFELSSEEVRAEVTRRLPRLRDSFISYLSDRTLEDLRGSEGMEKTKVALTERLHKVLPEKTVRALYITDFLVQ
jgi:flagellar protein FliL